MYVAGDNNTTLPPISVALWTIKFTSAGTYSVYYRWRADKFRTDQDPNAAKTVAVHAWLHEPGIPPGTPEPTSERLARVESLARQWKEGTVAARLLVSYTASRVTSRTCPSAKCART